MFKTKTLKTHFQADGAWQLTHAECGSRSRNGIITTNHAVLVDCKHCLKRLKEKKQ